MKTVWILALEGVLDSSLAITLDLLRTAQAIAVRSRSPRPFRFEVVGSRGRLETGGGLTLRTDATFRGVSASRRRPDWVIVPALGQYEQALTARLARPDAQQAARLIGQLDARRVPIAAACASVFLLAEAGILEGRTATTTWWLADGFRRRYPGVHLDERRMVVRDGSLLTAGAAFAQLDLMLSLLGDLVGLRVAGLSARYLVIDRRPSQARYMIASHARQHDETIAAAERWIDDHLAEPLTVSALAKRWAMSERTFARRVRAATGLSPIRLIQRRRLMMATHLIETTKASIENVATQVGYRDATNLRRLIRRDLATNPSGLRRG